MATMDGSLLMLLVSFFHSKQTICWFLSLLYSLGWISPQQEVGFSWHIFGQAHVSSNRCIIWDIVCVGINIVLAHTHGDCYCRSWCVVVSLVHFHVDPSSHWHAVVYCYFDFGSPTSAAAVPMTSMHVHGCGAQIDLCVLVECQVSKEVLEREIEEFSFDNVCKSCCISGCE